MAEGNRRFTCDWIFNILVVLSDGKVVCGCADPYGRRPLGHLEKSDILSIWNSDLARSIRRGLNNGYSEFCLDCGLRRPISDDEQIEQRPEEQQSLPRIFLEPTVLCNISCFKAVCNRESGIVGTRARKNFPLDQFERLMARIGPELGRLDLFNYGDPFVHPQCIDMVEHVKANYPHVYLYTSTNGLMLNGEKIARLIASGLDEITFSVDGVDQASYERYRCGGDFSKALAVMRRTVQARNATTREVPFINWRYILFRWNDSDQMMRRARRLAAMIDVDRLSWEITDHPPEARSERYQVGTPHWRRIYHEIWDTSQVGNAIAHKRNLARIRPPLFLRAARIGEPAAVEAAVRNTGGAPWLHASYSGRRLVRLGAQLHDADRKLINLDYARAFLPRTIRGGQKVRIRLELPALQSAGDWWLKFDMVSEGIDWFEKGGSPVVWRKLKVR